MEELASGPAALALMAVAALIIGYSKTALGGLGVVAVAIFATVLPAKESTAAILMVLIVGDVIACWHYRRDPDWSLIRRLLPAVCPGLVLGTLFLRVVDDDVLRRSIGAAAPRAAPAAAVGQDRAPATNPSTAHQHRAAPGRRGREWGSRR